MMKANHLPEDDTEDSSRTPLIPIGLTIVMVLMVPVFLYSVGPEGPLKVGDVVFATDRHRVKFIDPKIPQTQGYQDFCILESRVQLVVQKIEKASKGREGRMVERRIKAARFPTDKSLDSRMTRVPRC